MKVIGKAWLFIGFIVSSAWVSSAHASEGLEHVDRQTPDFNLVSTDNTVFDAESLSGKTWVVNFWATWCPPCIEEIPSMNAAWAVLKEEGVGMLAINAGEGIDAVNEFLKKVPIDFTTLIGNQDSLPNWSVRALPTTIVIDPSGRVVYEALGPREWDDPALIAEVLKLPQ